jgi:hypothetical protein
MYDAFLVPVEDPYDSAVADCCLLGGLFEKLPEDDGLSLAELPRLVVETKWEDD